MCYAIHTLLQVAQRKALKHLALCKKNTIFAAKLHCGKKHFCCEEIALLDNIILYKIFAFQFNYNFATMKYTAEQIAMMHLKDAQMKDALKRDPLINYTEGYFFLTLNTRGEAPILSRVVGRVGGTGADAPHCEYTALGKGVIDSWKKMPLVCPTVRIGPCEVMPEHFHGLLHLLPGNKRHLGTLVSGFMAGCTHHYWDSLGIDWRTPCMKDGVYTPRMHSRDRHHTRSYLGPALFVRGYNDVEALTAEEVRVKMEYIAKQAEKRLIQGDRHQCFIIRRNMKTAAWNLEVAKRAVADDRFYKSHGAKCDEACHAVVARFNIQGLDYIGDRRLLACEKKLPLICHRADMPFFNQQLEAVVNAARNGWVIVSAFISKAEREIRRQLLIEQLPVIEIVDNGFADRYRPTGKSFYATAENRLVQISCWNYQYTRDAAVSREMCLVMNELARVITQKPDDWWKRPL